MIEIVVLDKGYHSYTNERQLFHNQGYRMLIYDGPSEDMERKVGFAKNASGILVRGTRIDASAMEKISRLRAIVRYGTGYDNIDLAAAASRGIRVANVQGYANHAVSDHAMALMFACIRDLRQDPEQSFVKPAREEIFELHDKTVGIIGIGRIGSHFSRKASSLFKRTIAFDPYKDGSYMTKYGAEKVGMADILEFSHVISLHCALTQETRHLLNEDAFAKMRKRPVVINTARGPVVDEKALLKALEKEKIHSAGLDVFESEPPGRAQQQLLAHPLVHWSPHIAWYSDRSVRELQKRAAENMVGLLTGRVVEDEIHADTR